MRILSVGAGGIGGYFGARLVEKGEDVTFLVREKRQQLLKENQLTLKSVHGNYSFSPQLITTRDTVPKPFDLVLFTTKSYQLEQAIKDVKPFIGTNTLVLPLLNGIAHMKVLEQHFGNQLLGGLCFIESSVADDGTIIQESQIHRLVYGERDGSSSVRTKQLLTCFKGSNAEFSYSANIEQDMWHKYLFIAVASGITTLFRSSIGPIRKNDTRNGFIESTLNECANVMRTAGAPIADDIVSRHMETFATMSYTMKSSMLRDIERSSRTEGAHLQGYLLHLGDRHNIQTPSLQTIYQNLQIYEDQL
ncbi:ketopantoate reductase family protein [Bacillus sp. JCM 19041]|uniref:ketopantoate reductase family protein n=1 Tax=Bacillus sp. JCM 19041 TaxID=1460637 RepID=UPI0006CF7F82